MPDDWLLQLILDGIIVITKLNTAHPQLWVAGRKVKAHLNPQGGRRRIRGCSRWRWKIQHQGKCRRIVRAKLVWMFVNKQVVPPDHVIHHGRKGPLNDSQSNLECVSYARHQEIHYGTDSF
jgi:hypothetical protein